MKDLIEINDALLPVTEVPKLLPPRKGGRRLHMSTVFRWMKRDRFPFIQVGGTRYTTRKAIAAWSQARAARSATPHVHPSLTSDHMAKRSVAQAKALLRSPTPRPEAVQGVKAVKGVTGN